MLNSTLKDHQDQQNSEVPDNYVPQNSSFNKNILTRPSAITLKDTDQTQTGHSFNKRSISKSSRQTRNVIEKLKQQNQSLKQQIFTMKLSQFYQLDQKKVKGLLEQVQQLKEKIKYYRQELQKVLIEKDFLQRNNRNLKQQCFNLTKALMLQRREKTGRISKFTKEIDLQGISIFNGTKNNLKQSKKSIQRCNSSRKRNSNSPYKQLLRIRSEQNFKAQLFGRQSNQKLYKIQDK